ncbi:hypothetical protein J4G07_10125 [Candidatus Poribacteria bacterium]|nr:hypothetical protein [Candidatus Poribacteria bacterium]
MENILQMLGPLVIVILISILSNARRRKAQQRDAERQAGERVTPESEETPPPFMEDFPFETQLEQMILQQDEQEVVPVAEEPMRPEAEQPDPVVETPKPQPPPVPVESPTRTRSVPATSLLDLSPQTFRQGIILSEILGRPKSRSRRRPTSQ